MTFTYFAVYIIIIIISIFAIVLNCAWEVNVFVMYF